jgi:glutamate-1-semialdehyde 2,1-aminomutase
MLANGIYLAPSQFEAGFLSIVHNENVIAATLAAVEETFRTW